SGVLVSGAWRSQPSPEWTPDSNERASFDAFMAAASPLLLPYAGFARQGTRFFRTPPQSQPSMRWAVIGGCGLMIARFTSARWTVAYLENSRCQESGADDAYSPLAVVDIDGDGLPEVIYHYGADATYGESLLRFDGAEWERLDGVGGTSM